MNKMAFPTLIQHGIYEDESDWRIHICALIKIAYVFPTQAGKEAIKNTSSIEKIAWQKGISYPTGRGYCIPPNQISDCLQYHIPTHVWNQYQFEYYDSCGIKGRKAALIAKTMIEQGFIKIPMTHIDIENKDLQIKGYDLIVSPKYGKSIQVKCDYNGGDKKLGGTGNLFLQTHELNPLNIH